MWPVSTAAAHALFLLPHLAQPPFGPRPLHRVELSVHADAQLVGLAAQAIAALAGVLAIAPLAIAPLAIAWLAIAALAVPRWRSGPAAAVIALQIAVVVAD